MRSIFTVGLPLLMPTVADAQRHVDMISDCQYDECIGGGGSYIGVIILVGAALWFVYHLVAYLITHGAHRDFLFWLCIVATIGVWCVSADLNFGHRYIASIVCFCLAMKRAEILQIRNRSKQSMK